MISEKEYNWIRPHEALEHFYSYCDPGNLAMCTFSCKKRCEQFISRITLTVKMLWTCRPQPAYGSPARKNTSQIHLAGNMDPAWK